MCMHVYLYTFTNVLFPGGKYPTEGWQPALEKMVEWMVDPNDPAGSNGVHIRVYTFINDCQCA